MNQSQIGLAVAGGFVLIGLGLLTSTKFGSMRSRQFRGKLVPYCFGAAALAFVFAGVA